MSNVVPIRKDREPIALDTHPGAWGMVIEFASDDTRPMPKHDDQLLELQELLRQARHAIEAADARVALELLR